MLIVKKNGKYGIMGKGGKMLVPCIYNYIAPANEKLFYADKNGKYGYIDCYGEIKIPFIYDDCGAFSEGVATATKYGKKGCITSQGRNSLLLIMMKLRYLKMVLQQ